MIAGCVLILTVVLAAGSQVQVDAWAAPWSFYGYQCELYFRIVARKLDSQVHLNALNGIVLQTPNLSLAVEYHFNGSYQPVSKCLPDSQGDICIDLTRGNIRVYNSTHQSVLVRATNVYCPLNSESIVALAVRLTPAPEEVSPQNEVQELVWFTLPDIGYRDVIDITPTRKTFQSGCFTRVTLQLDLITTLSDSWNSIIMEFSSAVLVHESLCSLPCKLIGNTLYFWNPYHRLAQKNMSMWSLEDATRVFSSRTSHSYINLHFFMMVQQESTVFYNISLWSLFESSRAESELETRTENGFRWGSLDFGLSSHAGWDDCHAPSVILMGTNKSFINVFYMGFYAGFCILMMAYRKRLFRAQRILYFIATLLEIPLLLASYLTETRAIENSVLGFALYATLVLHVVVWILQALVVFCFSSSQYQNSNHSFFQSWKRYIQLGASLLNARLGFFMISTEEPNRKLNCWLSLIHACHQFLVQIITFTTLCLTVDRYVFLSDKVDIHMVWALFAGWYMLITSIVLKNCIVMHSRLDSGFNRQSETNETEVIIVHHPQLVLPEIQPAFGAQEAPQAMQP